MQTYSATQRNQKEYKHLSFDQVQHTPPTYVKKCKFWVGVQNFLRKSTPDGVQPHFLGLTDVLVLLILATEAEIWGPTFILEIETSWGPVSYSNDFLTYVGYVWKPVYAVCIVLLFLISYIKRNKIINVFDFH